MKQQTAMQLLFAEFKALSESAKFSGDEQTANLIDFLCEREPIALKKEEEQIKQAYESGIKDASAITTSDFKHGQKYFNQIYRDDTSK